MEIKPLSYSSAMRLGAMLKPQGFGLGRNKETSACANDAANLAAGGSSRRTAKTFPLAAIAGLHCPQCGEIPILYALNLAGVVAHLNDDHRWTRERIADYVQSIEDQLESKRQSEVVNGTCCA